MAIEEIQAGSKAQSKVLNDNFNYLQELVGNLSIKIDGSDATVDSKIATTKNSLMLEINKIKTDTETAIADIEKEVETGVNNATSSSSTLKTDVYTKGFLPNYSAGVSISTGYTTTKNGWVRWYTNNGDGGEHYLKVNSVNVGISSQYKYHNHKSLMFLVSKGDTIAFTNGTVTFYPCKGGV